jgi:hypothetical protein
MCVLKDVFWGEEEEVYQIHPKKSEYTQEQLQGAAFSMSIIKFAPAQ